MADPVNDGGVKTPECGSLKSMFGLCAVGAPMMPNVNTMDPKGQQVVIDKTTNGDYGKGLQKTGTAIQARMKALGEI